MEKLLFSNLIFLIFSASAQDYPRFALLIGNSNYKGGTNYLSNPINDIDTMEAKLNNCHFNVKKAKDVQTIDEFRSILQKFLDTVNQQKNCYVLFYYSGHGVQHETDNYLIPVKANITSGKDIVRQCFSLQEILNKLNESSSIINIIILDACRDNPFPSDQRGIGEKGLGIPETTLKGSFILYATSPNKTASDGPGERNSPLVRALASCLNTPGLTLFDLLKYVTTSVYQHTRGRQTPWGSVSIGRDFYLMRPTENSSASYVQKNIGLSGIDKGSKDISFFSTADCSFSINTGNDSVHETPGYLNERQIYSFSGYPDIVYRIKVISTTDPSVWQDTVFSFDANDAQIAIMFDLKKKLDFRSDSINNSPQKIEEKKIIAEINNNMIEIPGGEFEMGSEPSNSNNNDEMPLHRVKIGKFRMSRFEITQKEWRILMGYNPSVHSNCDDCPVENVSWFEVDSLIQKLKKMTGNDYKLPSEAEWEYAARGADLINKKYSYSGSAALEFYGWYANNSGSKTHPVGGLGGNQKGIFDMCGNVSEWCSDWYDPNYYSRIKPGEIDPQGPENPKAKVYRGGNWTSNEMVCKVYNRASLAPGEKKSFIGFRLAMSDR